MAGIFDNVTWFEVLARNLVGLVPGKSEVVLLGLPGVVVLELVCAAW